MNRQQSWFGVLAMAGVLAVSWTPGLALGAINEISLWELGEGGVGLPQDSVGGNHFSNGFGPAPTVTTNAPQPGSTAALDLTSSGFFGTANATAIPTDNFAVEMWARTDNPTQTSNDFFTTNGGPAFATMKFHALSSGNWAASLHNASWIGGNNGAGQPITAEKWTHLAVIREAGVSTFYIDGVAQAGAAPGTAPSVNTGALHLGVTPGGGSNFDGDLDNLRIFSFAPGDNPVSELSIVKRGLATSNGDFQGSGQMSLLDGNQDILDWFDSTPGFSSWEFGRPGSPVEVAGTLSSDGWMYQSLGTYFAENGPILRWNADAVNTNVSNGAGDPFEIDFFAGSFPGAADGVDILGQGLTPLKSFIASDSGSGTVDLLGHTGTLLLDALADGTEIWVRIGGGGFDGIDNVVVQQLPVPEPTTALLALLAGPALLRRRRTA